MQDPAKSMPAFTSEVVIVVQGVEFDALALQTADGVSRTGDGELDDVPVAEAGARVERIVDVRLDAVVGVHDGRNAALGPMGGTRVGGALAQNGDPRMRSQVEGRGKARGAAADNQDVGRETLRHDQVASRSGVSRPVSRTRLQRDLKAK